MRVKVLIIDDEPHILKTMAICLEDLGFDVTQCRQPENAGELIREGFFDLAFVDLKMTPVDGMAILAEIKRYSPGTTVVIITAHGSIESAVEAIKNGAFDYLQKPFDYLELQLFAKKTLDYHKLRQEVHHLREQVREQTGADGIITRNPKMLEMIDLAKRVAKTDLSVLIEGESGVGKELFAKLIFENSERVAQPFVKINCAAIPENLLESELFGHVKGGFTGAIKDRKGRFELADGGTIFLDEIGDLSPTLQAKLLRILQHGEYERVGESITRKTDVRIIAATNKNLAVAIQNGAFREDLFYRLNGVRIKLLPLRERPEDILPLIQYFVDKFSDEASVKISPAAMRAMQNYSWRGNVRELENAVRRSVLLAREHRIELEDLPEELQLCANSSKTLLSLSEMEAQHIRHVLKIARDMGEAAKILGIDPATLWRKRKKYNLSQNTTKTKNSPRNTRNSRKNLNH